ncbi:transglutaminase family protein [Acinetobacter baumannii]|uniref:transglutaminase family protein n=1 Tax=Acinetobacter baumannii TaxID=470 RepID=UPI00244974E2|nr:transglutaminase family protein [Acinetobacter baumannii]MDH2606859.1 transglutaminase family protein [Acinetobacter baumannii]MDO7422694.1 transglutaminase family protein [Acinetobacter baumannii]
MKLMVNHQTHYNYTETAKNSIQYIKMMPQTSLHQHVMNWAISVPGDKTLKRDIFNNIWITASQRYEYQHLTFMAQGIVELLNTEIGGVDVSIPINLFLQSTEATKYDGEMLDFAQRIVTVKDRQHIALLSENILQKMPYQPDSTSVHTTATQAFQAGQGVCQDHAHVLIAMCRALQLPARYVSGYLFDQNSPHLASHAWAEVFLDNQWYCFDVSNQLFTPKHHIYLAVGRDYLDVAPIRGVREKGGTENMMSVVQVLAC